MTDLILDFRFVEIEREVSALADFLTRIEPSIQHLIDEDRATTEAELTGAQLDWQDSEVQIAYQLLDDRANNVFPRFLRAAFLVSLWACYESAVHEIARERQRALGATLALKHIRAKDFLESAKLYFKAVINHSLDDDADRLRVLADLLTIRNVLAHGNGQADLISDDAKKRLEPVLARNPSMALDEEYLRIPQDFLLRCHKAVQASLDALIQSIRGPSVREAHDA